MKRIAFIGEPPKNESLQQLVVQKKLLHGPPCYMLTERTGTGLHVRELDPKLRKVSPEEAVEAVDLILICGRIGPKTAELLNGRETVPMEEYIKQRTHPVQKLPSIPVFVTSSWFPDALDRIREFESAGYRFYLCSNRADWDETLSFTRFRNPDASFVICLVDEGRQNVTCKTLRDNLLQFARKHVPVAEYATQMTCFYQNWEKNLHLLPGKNGLTLFLSCSRTVRQLSQSQLKILRALERFSLSELVGIPREELEQFTAMCQWEEWKSRYFAALLQTHTARIENYNDIIISYIGSHRCNMMCKYCFADHTCEALSTLSSGDAVEVADMLTGGRKNPKIHFDNNLGGEPLLNWQAVKNLHLALVSYHKTRGVEASFGLLTNGTELKTKHLEWLRHHIPYLGFSLDGDRKTHDAIRLDATRKPTYDRTVEGIRLVQKSDWPVECGVSTVISRYNLDISAIQAHIRDKLAVPNIVMKPVRAATGEDFALTYDDLPQLENSYRKFFRYLLDEGKKKNLEPLFTMLQPLDYAGRFLLRVFLADRVIVKRCGSGEHIFSVSDDASVYPCDSFNGIRQFEIANLQEGQHNRAGYHVPFVTEENEAFGCNRCWARYLCGGICQYVQYLNHYEHNDVTWMECGLAKFLIESAILFWQEARQTWDAELLEQVHKRVCTIGFRPMAEQDAFIYAPC